MGQYEARRGSFSLLLQPLVVLTLTGKYIKASAFGTRDFCSSFISLSPLCFSLFSLGHCAVCCHATMFPSFHLSSLPLFLPCIPHVLCSASRECLYIMKTKQASCWIFFFFGTNMLNTSWHSHATFCKSDVQHLVSS